MLTAKIKGIKTIIKKGLDAMQNPYLACSWGKDSVTLLYFLREIKPDIPVVFLNSGYSFPDIYEFRDRIIKEWQLNYIEIAQPIDYLELCKEVGLPHDRKQTTQNKTVKILKKDLLNNLATEKGFDGCFWGLRAEESKSRANLIRYKGNCFQSQGFWRCSPLAYLGNMDIWMIIDLLKIHYCSLYDKNAVLKRHEIRNSGWLSTDGAENGKILHIRRYYPELFEKLVENFADIRTYT